MHNTYRLLVFDLDGTVADSSDCIVASFDAALARHGLPTVDRADIVDRMGLTLTQVFRELTTNSCDDTDYSRLIADYRSTYLDLLPHKTRAFPGIRAVLEHLTESAVCTIATSKQTKLALASLRHIGLGAHFALCIGDDLVAHPKPHPEMLERTLAKTGFHPANAVMIGDAVTDIEMGQAIGMDTVAVTWGAHPADVLAAASPTYLVDSVDALTRFV